MGGYTATDLIQRFVIDLRSAITRNLADGYFYGSSSVRDHIKFRAVPTESFVSYRFNATTSRAWRIFNTIQTNGGASFDGTLNYLRMNRVIERSGVPTDIFVLVVNQGGCAAWAFMIFPRFRRHGVKLLDGERDLRPPTV